MKSNHQIQVEGFMRMGGHDVPSKPTVPSPEILRLRAKLILEEALETIEALGCSVFADLKNSIIFFGKGDLDISCQWKTDIDLTEIIDGCCDIAVVTTGTLSACGIPDGPFQEEVNSNNSLKLVNGVTRDESGKIMKPKDHPKPRIKEILDKL